jgi:hypothetical protein
VSVLASARFSLLPSAPRLRGVGWAYISQAPSITKRWAGRSLNLVHHTNPLEKGGWLLNVIEYQNHILTPAYYT